MEQWVSPPPGLSIAQWAVVGNVFLVLGQGSVQYGIQCLTFDRSSASESSPGVSVLDVVCFVSGIAIGFAPILPIGLIWKNWTFITAEDIPKDLLLERHSVGTVRGWLLRLLLFPAAIWKPERAVRCWGTLFSMCTFSAR